MRKFKITTSHSAHKDSFNEGELEYVNGFNIEEIVTAETPRKAIEKYFKETLFYKFDFKFASIRHEEMEDEEENTLDYSVLVDEGNCEASKEEIELWKKEEKTLYSNNIYLSIDELVKVKI